LRPGGCPVDAYRPRRFSDGRIGRDMADHPSERGVQLAGWFNNVVLLRVR